MSKITINSVHGENVIIGDHNTINNTNKNHVLSRDDYFDTIIKIRDLERISLSDYLQDNYQKNIQMNPHYAKILYKDINKALQGIDFEGDGELVIEDGDFAIENGDIKITGHFNNLHYALAWLHMQLIEEFSKEDSSKFADNWQRFTNEYLNVDNDSLAYSQRLHDLNSNLKRERKSKDKNKWTWNDINNIIDLKPNVAGIGINFNTLFSKLLKK